MDSSIGVAVAAVFVWLGLSRRTSAVLEGDEGRSRAHFAYVALEFVELVALVWTGVLLVGAWDDGAMRPGFLADLGVDELVLVSGPPEGSVEAAADWVGDLAARWSP